MSVAPAAIKAVSGVAGAKLKQLKSDAGYTAAAAIAGGVSVVFLTIAATAALSAEVGFIPACLIMAVVFAAATGVVLMLRQRAVERSKRAADAKAVNELVSAASSAISPAALSMAALAAGFALSRK